MDLRGDPAHIELMRKTPYGGRLVHGVFVLGLMSTVGAKLTGSLSVPTVSIGYDRVRFVRPVFTATR
jgi:acyl dehydratase